VCFVYVERIGIGSVEMDANEPALFEISDRKSPTPPEQPPRGRNRETWARMATAKVTIIDAEAVREAAARAEEGAVTIGLGAMSDHEDSEAKLPNPEAASGALDALAWLIWPTDGLESLLDANAVRILSVASEVQAESVDRGRITWTVTVKLIDVQQLRRLAAQAHPAEAGLIADSLAVAWQRAADPFAPLRSIPGIAWQPGHVEVQHMPRAQGRKH
jgi:hypothetical protein